MDMIQIIEDCLGKKAIIDYQPMQLGDAKESFADISKSTNMLHFEPSTDIIDGIPLFIEWYKKYHA